MQTEIESFKETIEGEVYIDKLHQLLYSTDASIYQERPQVIVLPANKEDIIRTVYFARENRIGITPRTAGTSLAGQATGGGIILDMSKYMREIIEINKEELSCTVEPGVIRDELNAALKKEGLYFGPNTSTANRAMIGGMVGNNSCGSTSIKYGTTRDHVLELEAVLSDGSVVEFKELDFFGFEDKCRGKSIGPLEKSIYRTLKEKLASEAWQNKIRAAYPHPEIHRRNMGYAVDQLLDKKPFNENGDDFSLCPLICGSEGTLAIISRIKLKLDLLPPKEVKLLCAHFRTVDEALRATVNVMKYEPYACELIDDVVLNCTEQNPQFAKYRNFVVGEPKGILIVEMRHAEILQLEEECSSLIKDLKKNALGYAFPVLEGEEAENVWILRRAGLGLLSNIKGDAKPVACIEDTAVRIEDLASYIREFEKLMHNFRQQAVYYAHAGAGELHLRPILDLKTEKGQQLLHDITQSVAELVKKYRGSMSGEHGDGRVRAPYIPAILGKEVYALLCEIKEVFDPEDLLNPGKIVHPLPVNQNLRYEAGQNTPTINTAFDWSESQGFVRAVEQCNGSADCRKSHHAGGTMCPSFHATLNEKDSTRGRANVLRQLISKADQRPDVFLDADLKSVMDLCLSCKGCTAECPSNVDMAAMKSEYLFQKHKMEGGTWRDWIFVHNADLQRKALKIPFLGRFFMALFLKQAWFRESLGLSGFRELPFPGPYTFRKWYQKNKKEYQGAGHPAGSLYLFIDEFSDLLDVNIAIDTYKLLHHLGYEVRIVPHKDSGRAAISKGYLKEAKILAQRNVEQFSKLISQDIPLVGIEPSAILSFVDEYPRLLRGHQQDLANTVKKSVFTLGQFLYREIEKGKISPDKFDSEFREIYLHGHCHEKALTDINEIAFVLGLPQGHRVKLMNTGCCGMAGTFGYEKEHYALSMKVGELVVFPQLRQIGKDVHIIASGTSCRHQILDGTAKESMHPGTFLFRCLKL